MAVTLTVCARLAGGCTAWEQRVKDGTLTKVPDNHPVTKVWKEKNEMTETLEQIAQEPV